MKRIAMLLLGAGIIISSDTPTTIYIPQNTRLEIVPDTADVCPSSTTVCPPPAVSSGPIYGKASTGDCFKIEKFNPNGSTVPPGPIYPWTTCP